MNSTAYGHKCLACFREWHSPSADDFCYCTFAWWKRILVKRGWLAK